MKMRIIFYKAKWGDGSFIDNAINTWTWLISAKNREVGDYAHVEVWTANEDGNYEKQANAYYQGGQWNYCIPNNAHMGTCWTSTMQGEDNGTVKRPASEVLKHPDRWDVCEVEVPAGYKYECGMNWMKAAVINNKGYSKWDIIRFISPIHFPDNDRNICSEFVNNALYYMGVWDKWGIVSPRRLAYKLKQAGYKIEPLNA